MSGKNYLYTVLAWLCIGASFVSQAHAGNDVGNGGDVVICAGWTPFFYDLYEAKKRHRLTPVEPEGFTLDAKVENLIARLDTLSPTRAGKYRKMYSTFWANTRFVEGEELIDIPDTGSGSIPAGCTLRQLIVQENPVFPHDRLFTFNLDLWKQLPLNDQAAAVLHELILYEARNLLVPHENSVPTRYLNAVIQADKLRVFTFKDWIDTLTLVTFETADFKNYPFTLVHYLEGANEPVRRPEIHYHSPNVPKYVSMHGDYEIDVLGQIIKFNFSYSPWSMSFHENGKLEKIQSFGKIEPFKFSAHGLNYNLHLVGAQWYPTGEIEGLGLDINDINKKSEIEFKNKKYGVNYMVRLYPDGHLRSMRIHTTYETGKHLITVDGEIIFDGLQRLLEAHVSSASRIKFQGQDVKIRTRMTEFHVNGEFKSFEVYFESPVPRPHIFKCRNGGQLVVNREQVITVTEQGLIDQDCPQ